MTTAGFCGDVEDKNVESSIEVPLEYLAETNECICGRCGQVLLSVDHNIKQIQAHFQICENAKENVLSMVFKELRKMKAEMSEMKKNEEKVKAEMRKEIENNKKEFDGKILELKSEFKKESEIKGEETKDVAMSTLFRKVKDLEEGVKEMGVAQEIKMAEVNGRVSGVTETICTVVHSMFEAKGSSSADTNGPDRSQKEIEALWEKMRENEREMKGLKTGLEEDVARLKTGTETALEQLKKNNKDLQVIKAQLKEEEAKNPNHLRSSS